MAINGMNSTIPVTTMILKRFFRDIYRARYYNCF